MTALQQIILTGKEALAGEIKHPLCRRIRTPVSSPSYRYTRLLSQ
jgi:hypothetical protein